MSSGSDFRPGAVGRRVPRQSDVRELGNGFACVYGAPGPSTGSEHRLPKELRLCRTEGAGGRGAAGGTPRHGPRWAEARQRAQGHLHRCTTAQTAPSFAGAETGSLGAFRTIIPPPLTELQTLLSESGRPTRVCVRVRVCASVYMCLCVWCVCMCVARVWCVCGTYACTLHVCGHACGCVAGVWLCVPHSGPRKTRKPGGAGGGLGKCHAAPRTVVRWKEATWCPG